MDRWGPKAWKSSRIAGDMERFVDDVLSEVPARMMRRRPATDMYETPDSYVLRTELPGVAIDDVDISAAGGMLTIRGERRAPEGVKDDQYHSCEMYYGPISRSISIPEQVDINSVEATHENGVMEIRMPKTREAAAHRINVKPKSSGQ